MKYLFFDCEFANCFDSKEKICEFGYVMVDENFNVLYKDNIIINPNIKDNEWDWYALKKILTRKRDEYKNRLFFPAYHKKIMALIQNADFILGHTIEGDVHALNCELQRYNLPCLDFEFYDIKEMYKAYNDSKKTVSVENILLELGIQGDDNKHDAGADAFNTMLELKTILEKLDFELEEMIEICPKAKDKTESFLIDSRVRAEQARAERQKAMLEGDYSDGSNDMLSMRRRCNKKTFVQFLDNVQVTAGGSGKCKDKKISISINYECKHFKEMMNLVQIIKNEGGEYVLKGSEADIFVTYASFHEDGTPWLCNREKYVDIALAEGKQIQKMTFDEFLSMLEMTNEELESLPLPPIDCLFREGAVIKDKKMKRK